MIHPVPPRSRKGSLKGGRRFAEGLPNHFSTQKHRGKTEWAREDTRTESAFALMMVDQTSYKSSLFNILLMSFLSEVLPGTNQRPSSSLFGRFSGLSWSGHQIFLGC